MTSKLGGKVLAGSVAGVFFYVVSPLIFPIAMGGVLAILFWPWRDFLERKQLKATTSSAILTVGITVILILPSSLLIFLVAKTGFNQLHIWKRSMLGGTGLLESLMNMPHIHRMMIWVTRRFPVDMVELADSLESVAGGVWSKVAEILGGILTHLPGVTVSLVVMVVSFYFFLADGKKLLDFVRKNTLLTPAQTERLLLTLKEMSRSVILASIVSGGAQALIEMITCVLTRTSNAPLIAFLVFVASFIPIVGSLPITLTIALQQLLEGRQAAGVTLLIMAFVIFAIDNMVRPLFLRGSANLHPLMAFVAAFGGLQMLGFWGVFLGPIVAALFVNSIPIVTHARKNEERD